MRFHGAILSVLLVMGARTGCSSQVADTVVSPYARPLWEHPLTAVATTGMLVAGSSTLLFDAASRQNHLVRERVQIWRRDNCGFASIGMDDYLQYLPVVAVEGLDLMGVPSRHTGWPLLHRTGFTMFTSFVVLTALKYSVGEMRPDHSATNSFPSGHTTFAFAGAELMRREYGGTSSWFPAAGFTVAGVTGLMRVYNDRHWLGDVLAGAALGILSADFSCWLNEKLEARFSPQKRRDR